MVERQPVRVERRLSAILAADVAGYSRLMHNHEEATHAKVTALLAESVEPAIAEHGGRIVKNTGDGFLAEFPSAVEAVRAAVHFQTPSRSLRSMRWNRAALSSVSDINIGDVIVEPHDIFGDGVNIAARLEGIAEPGGICISSSAYDQVRGKVGVEFADLGEQNLKNIARPVRAYARRLGWPCPCDKERQYDRAHLRATLVHRCSTVREYRRRSRAGLFRRWRDRKPDHGPVAHRWLRSSSADTPHLPTKARRLISSRSDAN